MNKLKQLKKILRKYRIEQPLPDEIKKEMRKAKKDVLVKILKENGQYSLFILLVLSVFLWFRYIGIGISVAKSAIVVMISSMIVTALVSTGTYYSIKYIKELVDKVDTKKQVKHKNELFIRQTQNRDIKHEHAEKKDEVPTFQYRINVLRFSSGSDTQKIAFRLSDMVVQQLVKLKGKKAANLITSINGVSSKRVLTGSMSKIGDTYILNAKIIDPTTSEALLFITEEFKNPDTVRMLSKKIAAKVVSRL